MSDKSKICCSSVNDAMTSIALEETAISHILNAEGEKIQKALTLAKSVDELLKINCSVQNTIIDITSLENVLYNKLRTIVKTECAPSIKIEGSICVYVYCCSTKRPMINVCVKILSCKMTIIASGVTDRNGCYCVNCIPCGEYRIVVCDELSGAKELVDVCINENQKDVTKQICLKTSCNTFVNICGTVLDNCGNRLCNALVAAEGFDIKKARTDRWGNFEITNLKIRNSFNICAECNGKSSGIYRDIRPTCENFKCNLKINM